MTARLLRFPTFEGAAERAASNHRIARLIVPLLKDCDGVAILTERRARKHLGAAMRARYWRNLSTTNGDGGGATA